MDEELISLSLEEKVAYSKKIITEANERFNGNIVVTFTNGKNIFSTLHPVERHSKREPVVVFEESA